MYGATTIPDPPPQLTVAAFIGTSTRHDSQRPDTLNPMGMCGTDQRRVGGGSNGGGAEEGRRCASHHLGLGGLSALGGFTLGCARFAVLAGASGSRSAKPSVR